MKIIILLFAIFFGFGLASQEVLTVKHPKEVTANVEQLTVAQEPMMHVVLDTVEITVSAPHAIAGI
ncbi:hypothetical protein ACSX1A_12775 [Pontibacter sp. MBLB2868]|uniref:hypothetical protein n=1 Tax=Pontibacter sp. MBLB2868 TaxID=3451555 RepID=UPI003F74C1B3